MQLNMKEELASSEARFAELLDKFLEREMSGNDFRPLQDPSSTSRRGQHRLSEAIEQLMGPIALNPWKKSVRQAYETLYVSAEQQERGAVPSLPSAKGFAQLYENVVGGTFSCALVVAKRGAGKTIALNKFLCHYWDQISAHNIAVFRADVAKLNEHNDNRKRKKEPVRVDEYMQAHAYYVALKYGSFDPLLRAFVTENFTPMVDDQELLPDLAAPAEQRMPFPQYLKLATSVGPTGDLCNLWEQISNSFLESCVQLDTPGDLFSLDIIDNVLRPAGQAADRLYKHFVRCIKLQVTIGESDFTKFSKHRARVLLIVDGIDNVRSSNGESTYERLLDELVEFMPRGEGSPYFDKTILVVREDTECDLQARGSSLPAQALGKSTFRIRLENESVYGIVGRRVSSAVQAELPWIRKQLEKAKLPLHEVKNCRNEFEQVAAALSDEMGAAVGLVRGEKESDLDFMARCMNAGCEELFNGNLRSMLRNLCRSFEYLRTYFPPAARLAGDDLTRYVSSHRSYLREGSLLAGHPTFTRNSDDQIKGRWCPNLFEWTLGEHRRWGGLVLTRLLQLVAQRPNEYCRESAASTIGFLFDEPIPVVLPYIDLALEFGLLRKGEKVTYKESTTSTLILTKKGEHVRHLPFKDLPVTYFMGAATKMNKRLLDNWGGKSELTHSLGIGGRDRRFLRPALKTSLLLMRHVKTTHEKQMERLKTLGSEEGWKDCHMTISEASKIFALPDIEEWKKTAKEFFHLLPLATRQSVVASMEHG